MIRSTNHNVSNRIFDKPLTLMVDPSNRAGASGEHSPCDALVPSIVTEWALVNGIDESRFNSVEPEPFPPSSSRQADMIGWERLEWEVDDKIISECEAARDRAKSIIDNSDDAVFWFEDYGTDWIKDVGRLPLPLPLLFLIGSMSRQLSTRRTLTFKWHCNWHTTKRLVNSARPTRLL